MAEQRERILRVACQPENDPQLDAFIHSTDIKQNIFNVLEYLEFGNDACVMKYSRKQMQIRTNGHTANKINLKINVKIKL